MEGMKWNWKHMKIFKILYLKMLVRSLKHGRTWQGLLSTIKPFGAWTPSMDSQYKQLSKQFALFYFAHCDLSMRFLAILNRILLIRILWQITLASLLHIVSSLYVRKFIVTAFHRRNLESSKSFLLITYSHFSNNYAFNRYPLTSFPSINWSFISILNVHIYEMNGIIFISKR